MVVEYDTEAGAFYVRVTEEPVARTAEVSAFVNVDLDAEGNVVGLELLCLPAAVTVEERVLLEDRYPGLSRRSQKSSASLDSLSELLLA
jgi:uncharacterized protein YuzE